MSDRYEQPQPETDAMQTGARNAGANEEQGKMKRENTEYEDEAHSPQIGSRRKDPRSKKNMTPTPKHTTIAVE